MADHLTEEEQIEAIKAWFKENWVAIVLPITLVLVGYIGWNISKSLKFERATQGSEQYQALVDVLENKTGQELSEDAKTQARVLATQLIEEFDGTLYADMSNLMLAKLDVDAKKIDEAKTRLQAVIKSPSSEAALNLAQARLAKLELQSGNYDKALNLVGATSTDAYKALFAEIRGDIYAAQNNKSAANTAYKDALINLTAQQKSRQGLLQLKIDSTSLPAKDVLAMATSDVSESMDKTNTDKKAIEADMSASMEKTE